MKRLFASLSLAVLLVPGLASAAEPVSRRDGLLLIWTTIVRPAEPKRSEAFDDVPEGAPGYDVITFTHGRGFLDDTIDEESGEFRPDEPLKARDALLWLVRTRNVDDPDNLTPESLTGYLERYGLTDLKPLGQTVTLEELQSWIQRFDAAMDSELHLISNYGEELQGEGTAFGEKFDWHQMTAAHKTLPYNTLLKVTNTANGKSVVVRINDRGPYVDGRDLDLSAASFQLIAGGKTGILYGVTIERLGDVNMVGECGREPRMQQRIGKDLTLDTGVPQLLELGGALRLTSRQWFVVRGVTYPDGTVSSFQDWVAPGESYDLTPGVVGEYAFSVGTVQGRRRDMTMRVIDCRSPEEIAQSSSSESSVWSQESSSEASSQESSASSQQASSEASSVSSAMSSSSSSESSSAQSAAAE